MADRSEVIRPAGIQDTRSVGDIVQAVLRDIQDMVRSELRLARAEMTEKAQKAAKAGGLLGAAAVCGLLAAICVAAAIVAGFAAMGMPVWLAAVITAVLLGSIGGACYAWGRSKLRKIQPVPEQTVETIKEDVEWAKNRTK